tara:strand:- start:2384 stop:2857 length:474 start_codon:yes stop_codon:yes gene_type:complete
MLCFPLPNKNELVYSLIARAGVVLGEVNSQRLLSSVVNNKNYVATLDLPTNLEAISNNYPDLLGIDAEYLMFKHKLLPLYAPFIEPTVLNVVMASMASSGKAKIHAATGASASIVSSKKTFLFAQSALLSRRILGKCCISIAYGRHQALPVVSNMES